jgi:hypothetical protein
MVISNGKKRFRHDQPRVRVQFSVTTDRLALMKSALEALQQQLKRAQRDAEDLEQLERQALQDPQAFVQQLAAGTMNVPHLQRVVQLPHIDFEKYGLQGLPPPPMQSPAFTAWMWQFNVTAYRQICTPCLCG